MVSDYSVRHQPLTHQGNTTLTHCNVTKTMQSRFATAHRMTYLLFIYHPGAYLISLIREDFH